MSVRMLSQPLAIIFAAWVGNYANYNKIDYVAWLQDILSPEVFKAVSLVLK